LRVRANREGDIWFLVVGRIGFKIVDLLSLYNCSREICFDGGVEQVSDVVVSLNGKAVHSFVFAVEGMIIGVTWYHCKSSGRKRGH
jgi:hypothetical protein